MTNNNTPTPKCEHVLGKQPHTNVKGSYPNCIKCGKSELEIMWDKVTPTPKEWKEEFDEKFMPLGQFCGYCQDAFNSCSIDDGKWGEEIKKFISTLLSQQKQEIVEEIIDEIKKDFKRRTEKDEKPDYTIGRERTLADVLGRLRNYLLENE